MPNHVTNDRPCDHGRSCGLVGESHGRSQITLRIDLTVSGDEKKKYFRQNLDD